MILAKKNDTGRGRKLSLNIVVKKPEHNRKTSLPHPVKENPDLLVNSRSKSRNQLSTNPVKVGKPSIKKELMQHNSANSERKLSLNLDNKAGLIKNRKTSLPQKSEIPGQNEENKGLSKSGLDNSLFDDLFSTDRGSVSSGYHSIYQNEDRKVNDDILEESNSESSDESCAPEEEDEKDAELEFEGESALDMFIDPLNPFGKAVHSTLQSKINDQKEKEEDLKKKRAEKLKQIKLEKEEKKREKLRQMQLEKEHKKREKVLEKMKRRLGDLHLRKQEQVNRTDALNERLTVAQEREANYYRRYEVWKDKMENLYQEQLEVTLPLEEECSNMRAELYSTKKAEWKPLKQRWIP